MLRDPPEIRMGRLAWTMGGIGLAIAPHVVRLPLWMLVFLAGIMVWRVAAERAGWPLPSKIVRMLIAVAGIAGVLLTYRTINGLDAGSALLIMMMGMKLMETQRRRDETVLLLVSYFLVLASFLYSQSMWTLMYLFVTVWVITTALLQISRTKPAPPSMAAAMSA